MSTQTQSNLTPSIPTRYAGVNFRSRLEAKWAAFFDRCGWAWQYEPLDLRGYLPDFILPFERGHVLAEIKGTMDVVESEPTIKRAITKIERSGWTGEALILGAWIKPRTLGAPDADFPCIGLVSQRGGFDSGSEKKCWCWGEAALFFCETCRRLSITHATGGWNCMAGFKSTSCDHHFFEVPARWHEDWIEAGNEVQWRRASA